MRSVTIRLPDKLVREIETESQVRHLSKSDIVRERLARARQKRVEGTMRELIGDLIGSITGLPSDLSSKKKAYLPKLIHAKKLHRG